MDDSVPGVNEINSFHTSFNILTQWALLKRIRFLKFPENRFSN